MVAGWLSTGGSCSGGGGAGSKDHPPARARLLSSSRLTWALPGLHEQPRRDRREFREVRAIAIPAKQSPLPQSCSEIVLALMLSP